MFNDPTRVPKESDYSNYFNCEFSGYNMEDNTGYVIIPNYLDIKSWVMEHYVPDGIGWFEVVREERVRRNDVGEWELVGDDILKGCNSEFEKKLLADNIKETFEIMERYYEVQ